jgi:hypothetical protein
MHRLWTSRIPSANPSGPPDPAGCGISRLLARLVAGALAAVMAWTVAAAEIETRPIQFAKGASSATVKGTIKGDRTVDYTVRARAGQAMTVKLATRNGANYFNLLPPGSNDVAIFVGSTGGNEWTGVLPSDGDYTVRVYLMRSAARRNESASYTLTVGVTGGAGQASSSLGKAPPGDARVKGTPYHATGPLPCSMGSAPAGASQCTFGVIRGKPGNAEVHVMPAGGGPERVLTFMGDTVTSGTSKVRAERSGDLWSIEVDDREHYQVPQAVISGG